LSGGLFSSTSLNKNLEKRLQEKANELLSVHGEKVKKIRETKEKEERGRKSKKDIIEKTKTKAGKKKEDISVSEERSRSRTKSKSLKGKKKLVFQFEDFRGNLSGKIVLVNCIKLRSAVDFKTLRINLFLFYSCLSWIFKNFWVSSLY